MTQIETGDKNPAAYHWGRLLAVLEAIQRKALEKPGNPLNSTLVDRNYGAASTAPGTVFGRLFSGAQDHLKKIRIVSRGTAEAFQKQIEGIVSGHLVPEDGDPLQGLQRRFTVQEQALFALGYYHQRAKNRADARIGRAKRDAAGEESTEPAEENEDEE